MLFWRADGKTVKEDGSRTVVYVEDAYPRVTIVSYRRPIPHANRGGTWMYTDFAVLVDGREDAVKHTLRDAKAYAEKLIAQMEEEE